MRLKKNIATSEEGFIFNPGTGDSFSTNEIGGEIISRLKEGKSFQLITESICTRYDVDKTQFERDLDDYLAQLKDFAILD
jgi:hypothetical protein